MLVVLFLSLEIYGQNNMSASANKNNQLPVEITSYIKTSFPNHKIIKHNMDDDDKGCEVYLDKEIVLDFNSKNEIVGIDGKSKLPDTAIPPKILAYVKSSFSSNSITDWELEDKVQQITLNNGVELEFNKSGEYILTDK